MQIASANTMSNYESCLTSASLIYSCHNQVRTFRKREVLLTLLQCKVPGCHQADQNPTGFRDLETVVEMNKLQMQIAQ